MLLSDSFFVITADEVFNEKLATKEEKKRKLIEKEKRKQDREIKKTINYKHNVHLKLSPNYTADNMILIVLTCLINGYSYKYRPIKSDFGRLNIILSYNYCIFT